MRLNTCSEIEAWTEKPTTFDTGNLTLKYFALSRINTVHRIVSYPRNDARLYMYPAQNINNLRY